MDDLMINGYRLEAPLTNKNAGFSKWAFAEKDGKKYFIKEFLEPLFPPENAPYSPAMREKIRKNCAAYEARKARLYATVNKASDGNIVRVRHFFRCGSRYYAVTDKVETDGVDIAFLQKRELDERVRICLNLSHSMLLLHHAGLIHGDIKVDNVLFEKTIQGFVTSKIIDIDDCFFVGDPPDKIVGDQVYYAPERALVKLGKMDAKDLTGKIDVFSMGILFHEILTGDIPKISDAYTYVFEACLDNSPVKLSESLPDALAELLERMLVADPGRRCSSEAAYESLQQYFAPRIKTDTPPDPPPERSDSTDGPGNEGSGNGPGAPASKLRINMGNNSAQPAPRLSPGLKRSTDLSAVPPKFKESISGYHECEEWR